MRKCPTHHWSGPDTGFLMGWVERNCPWGLGPRLHTQKGHMRLPLCIHNPKEFGSEPVEGLGHPSSEHVLHFLSLTTTVWLESSPTCSQTGFTKAAPRCPALLVHAMLSVGPVLYCTLVCLALYQLRRILGNNPKTGARFPLPQALTA